MQKYAHQNFNKKKGRDKQFQEKINNITLGCACTLTEYQFVNITSFIHAAEYHKTGYTPKVSESYCKSSNIALTMICIYSKS